MMPWPYHAAVISWPFVEQHALNRQAWERLVNDPALAKAIETR
jgi:hypothetical protein